MTTKLTNAERINRLKEEFGPDFLDIRSVPNSGLKIVSYKTLSTTPNWSIIVCALEETDYKLLDGTFSMKQRERFIEHFCNKQASKVTTESTIKTETSEGMSVAQSSIRSEVGGNDAQPSHSDDQGSSFKSFIIVGIIVYIVAMLFLHNSEQQAVEEYLIENEGNYPQTFYGYDCTDDCSGHRAGYAWAAENNIDWKSECGGHSQSFKEGCYAWVENR